MCRGLSVSLQLSITGQYLGVRKLPKDRERRAQKEHREQSREIIEG
jgi:hypothetical protein